MDHQTIATSTACPGVDAARTALAAVLAGDPDIETTLVVSEAVDVLSDVRPPLPPLDYPQGGIDPEEGMAQALSALEDAVEEASSGEEALRAGRAAHLLGQLLRRTPEPAAPRGPVLP
jgi:hypothetical protein